MPAQVALAWIVRQPLPPCGRTTAATGRVCVAVPTADRRTRCELVSCARYFEKRYEGRCAISGSGVWSGRQRRERCLRAVARDLNV